jgi:hypothetical protein
MDANYIASHIYKITHLYINQPSRIENSLWRIASNANLFWDGENDNLDNDGTLTEEQREKVWEFIEEFKTNPSNQEALKMLQQT